MKAGSRVYSTVTKVEGPLIVVDGVEGIGYGEVAEVIMPSGEKRLGQVLESRTSRAIVQVFGGTRDLDTDVTSVRFSGETMKSPLAEDMLGRIFDGVAQPLDGGEPVIPEVIRDIHGTPINPYSREFPRDSFGTGLSVVDGMNTLVRGQKLPLFSGSGLPHNLLAAQIARQAKVTGQEEGFAVVFAAMGITHEEASFFVKDFRSTGALSRAVIFQNLADDPAIERIITPRLALTTAEFFAFTRGMHVLVILTDMINYCEALREISTAREEVPGRRGYPGYMYTDLASIYERAGRVKGKKGSITQIPILTMPDDDITHPIADLTGYITEGQIVLSRALHQKGIYPPIDVLPSLSRLMNAAIGEGKTRSDHRVLADQLYSLYAQGNDLRQLVAIVGEGALSKEESQVLAFANEFEHLFIHQHQTSRTVEDTLNLAWSLLGMVPQSMLKRIPEAYLNQYLPAE